ncbi:hypothetical protein Y032_0037g3375 [Ancylostoma ceylanicum]|uniref:Uncharacterized protein n=1 Tax=Ancylostoma ceylanicum TaxID=53326 RepID=A0A016UK27_9BILA|nr:hypothetical protein Y032_0037g3375 [Ancylostoma ceylanicum]
MRSSQWPSFPVRYALDSERIIEKWQTREWRSGLVHKQKREAGGVCSITAPPGMPAKQGLLPACQVMYLI